jgi:RNA 2',3'-cyclic 3'-phosphodiesterase
MSAARERRSSVRLFFALVPPSDARARLGILARDVATRTQGRAVEADNLHLTLAFLGEVETMRIDALQAMLPMLPRARFALALAHLGMFRNANLAWIAPSEIPAALVSLQEALQQRLARAAFRIEERAFRPHMTLARRCALSLPRQAIAPIPWDVSTLALMESQAGAAGIRYIERASVALGDRGS